MIKEKILHQIELIPSRIDKKRAIEKIENDIQTFDKNNNIYVWMSGDAMHYTVESFLLRHDNIVCNQNRYFDIA